MRSETAPGARTVTTRPPEPEPLSPRQKAALTRGRRQLKSVLRPARVAAITAGSVAVFGALSLLWGLVGGGGSLVIGAALLAVAWNERRGLERVRQLDPEGARILGWNQLVLAGVVVGYSLLAIQRAQAGPGPEVRELEELVGYPTDLIAELTTMVYGGVIVIVGVFQGLLARFHFQRQSSIEAYVRETPDWVVEVLAP